MVAGVFRREGKERELLLFRRGPEESWAGHYEFPGGKVEPGESELEALRRELKEELGIDAQVGEFISENRWMNGTKWIFLRCYWVDGNLDLIHLKNHDHMLWVSSKTVPWDQTAPADHSILREIFLKPNWR